HFCPFYDSEKARVDNHYTIPCQDHKVNCPQHYRSNEAYKYQECYVGVHGTHIFNSSTANNGEKEEENKALIVQWNTRWSLIFIIIGVFIISIFLIIITVLQLMRKESQQDCRDCWKCCCPTFKEGHIDEKGKGEPYQNGVKKNEREFEQLMENENL
ncbi:uncharacterized protein LOC134245084, partial [Saccostrea cucullata]|uniref:uncharacterized protein LOC134245084 n=1 Tax=Saccostrea cuccullata TaxID=36930 RepID=UPI002ECFD54A